MTRHGFHFSKSLGQNFLCARHVPTAIAQGAGIDENTGVLEVGPGIGTLTRELCQRARRVVAVELDRRLPPVLQETLGEFDNFHLVEGDILKTNIPQLCREELGEGRKVACANLPYYITTPALTALVDSGCFAQITVMVQKEVARRICAKPGTGDYGAFSVYCQFHGKPSILLDVPAGCFIPAPKVDSAVVALTPHEENPLGPVDEGLYFRVVRAAFAQRRKTLLNCLRHGFPQLEREDVLHCLEEAGIGAQARGETLGQEDFARLTEAVGRRLQKE